MACGMNELGERKENIAPNPVIFSFRLHTKRCVPSQLLHVQTEAGTWHLWHILGISKSLLGDIFAWEGEASFYAHFKFPV